MKTINLIIYTFCFLFSILADARVSVSGYYRKNGTYVAPHYRSSPDSSFYNNWSTKGNVNPYTGKEGTKTLPSIGSYDTDTSSSNSYDDGNLKSSDEQDSDATTTSSSASDSELTSASTYNPPSETPETTKQLETTLTNLKSEVSNLKQKMEQLEQEVSSMALLNRQEIENDSASTKSKPTMQKIYAPAPQYTRDERLRGLQGTCKFLLYVNKNGLPVKVRITKSTGHHELDQKTLNALKEWRFEPGDSGWIEQSFRWELKGSNYAYSKSLRPTTNSSDLRQYAARRVGSRLESRGITNAFYVTEACGPNKPCAPFVAPKFW